MSMDFDKLCTLPGTTQEILDRIKEGILALAKKEDMASKTDLIVTGHVGTQEHEWIAFMPDKFELAQGGATEAEAIGNLWLASAGDRIAHLLFPLPGERDETEQIQPMLFHYQFAPDGTVYLESADP